MRRRPFSGTQAVLLLILLLLVALWFRSERRRPQETIVRTVERFPADRVEEIVIRRGDASARVVRRSDGFWMEEPYPDRADAEMISQSLRAAATIEVTRALPDTGGAPFGLSPPGALWICRWDGGEYRIALGDTLPAGGGRYARLDRDRGVVILDPFIARRFLAPPLRDLHDPSATRIQVGPVDSVVIVTREEEIRVVRHRADWWEILSPVRCEGSATELSRAVHMLSSDALTEFIGPTRAADLRAIGLTPPRAVWTLIQGARRESVRIGSPTGDQRNVHIIPAGRDVVARIGSDNFRTWVDGMARLRETRLFFSAADSVARVTVRGAGAERSFARRPRGNWFEMAGAETLAIRSDAMESAVSNLCALRAVRFLGDSARIGDDDRVRLTVQYERGGIDALEIARPDGEIVPARGPRQPGWCGVPASVRTTWSLWLDRPLRPNRAAAD